MRLNFLPALSVVSLAFLASVGSSGGTQNRIPDGYFDAAVDPREPVMLKAGHYVVVPGREEGRPPSVKDKQLQFWVETELKRSGAKLVTEPKDAAYIVFISSDTADRELEVTKSRPHSGVAFNSDGTWSTTTVDESYQATETYVVRRVCLDVYSTRTREPIWQGYMGLSEEEYRKCPGSWVRDLTSIYPTNFEGRSQLEVECTR